MRRRAICWLSDYFPLGSPGLIVGLCLLLLLPVGGCRRESTVMEDLSQPVPVASPSPPMPPPQATPAAPAGRRTDAPPVLPGSSANVPEMLTRPFTPQELDKALEQLPPAVRQQIRGLGYSPSTIPAPVQPTPPAPARRRTSPPSSTPD